MKGKCKWKAAILILIIVGLLKEFRPSGPFLVDYAVDHKNFTTEQMTHEVLPATTGSYIVSLILLLMVTDALCYKPIIVFGSAATIWTWVVTIFFFEGVNFGRLRQALYGMSVITTEVAYFTYMYANIEKEDYKKVTSYTHSAIHFGQFLSGLVGQLLLSFSLLDFEQLNYLSLAGAIGSLLFSLLLPRVLRKEEQKNEVEASTDSEKVALDENPKTSVVATATDDDPEKQSSNPSPSPPPGLNYNRNVGKKRLGFVQRWKEAPGHAKDSIRYAYTNVGVIKYSVWWAMSYGLYIQVDLYIESLWKEIEHHSHQNVYNGAVYMHPMQLSVSVCLGLLIGRTKLCWITWGCTVFGVGTVLQGVALFVMSQTHDLYVAYAAFIVFQTLFQVLVIVSKFIVAESIRENSEAFIFGVNSLAACLIHLALTFSVTSRHGFKLPIQNQYIVYGVYAVLLGVSFYFCDIIRKCAGQTLELRNSLSRNRKIDDTEKDKDNKDEKGGDENEKETNFSSSMPYSIPREH